MTATSSKQIDDSRQQTANICFLLFAFCYLLCGRAQASGEADAFALPGVGARPGGMGGAFIGLSDDIESVYYNPAGLGNLKQSGMTAMYQTPSLDTSRGFLAFNKAWEHETFPGSFALGWLRLQSKNIELTSAQEDRLGTETLSNDLVLLGVGIHPIDHFSFGVTLKYFRFGFNGFNESGFGFDVGAHAIYDYLRLGLVLTDLDGTTLRGNSITPGAPDAKDVVPGRMRPGIALVFNKPLGLPLDLDWDFDEVLKMQGAQDARFFTGMELWGFNHHTALRGGYQQYAGPTVGLGLAVGMLQFDYSYLFSLHLQDENRLGVSLRF